MGDPLRVLAVSAVVETVVWVILQEAPVLQTPVVVAAVGAIVATEVLAAQVS